MKNKTSTSDLTLSNNERLYFESPSIFKPKKFSNINPKGLKIYTFQSGFKKSNEDLLVIIFDKLINNSCVYSQTSTPSAPILWDKKNNKGKTKALIVNAGNANAHTGNKGIQIIDNYTKYLSKKLNCNKDEILVSSTGVIGEIFKPSIINNQLDKIFVKKTSKLLDAAKTIMTTDTFPKISILKFKLNGKTYDIFGIAKGSGMIQPNMGTMLVYIFIEPQISRIHLKKLIKNNLEETFNSISVDSDTSTSDTLALFSLGTSNINLNSDKNFNIVNRAVRQIMMDLALKVVKDGEGLSKLLKINVTNAKNKIQAKNIGFSVANSPLVKTAIAAEDANWGRVIMAIGKTKEKIIQNKIKINFGKNIVCEKGAVSKKINNNKLNNYMKSKTIIININLGLGKHSSTVYGNDLTKKYVEINGEYRS